MKLKIESTTLLSRIRSEFNTIYPFLKLEFFKTSHETSEPSSKKEMINEDVPVGKLQKIKKTGHVEFSNAMKVQELEEVFRDEFGLNVQVFRNSGNLWLETSGTDSMTLAEQNKLGKEKSTPPQEPDLTDIDYD